MSRDPSYAVQKAVYGALSASPNIASETVFETVPAGTPLPWIIIGDDIVQADNDAGPHSAVTVIVDVFAEEKAELKTLTRAVIAALDRDLQFDGFAVGEAHWTGTRYVRDRDGKTEHAVIEFEYYLIPKSGE